MIWVKLVSLLPSKNGPSTKNLSVTQLRLIVGSKSLRWQNILSCLIFSENTNRSKISVTAPFFSILGGNSKVLAAGEKRIVYSPRKQIITCCPWWCCIFWFHSLEIWTVPSIKMCIHSLFVAVSLCEEDLALTIYYMTEEAGCSLPPTELSLCTCLGKLCRLTATQPHFLRTKTQ